MPSICRPMLNSRRTSGPRAGRLRQHAENAGMGQRNLRCSPEAIRNLARAIGQGSQGVPRVDCLGPHQQHRQPAPARRDRGRHGRPHGQSGHMTGSTMHVTSGNGGPALIKGRQGRPAEIRTPVDDHINGNEVWDAVIDGTYTFTGTKHYDPAEKRDIDIHVIYHPAATSCRPTWVWLAHRGPSQGGHGGGPCPVLTSAARYADIILPSPSSGSA